MIIVLATIVFGLLFLGNVFPVRTAEEKTPFTLSSKGAYYEHVSSKRTGIVTDYEMVKNLESGQYELFVKNSHNSYGSIISVEPFLKPKQELEAK